MRRLILGTAVVVVALTLASLALAGTGYEGQAGGVQGQLHENQGVESAGAAGGALPFTGQDLTIFVGAGIALILAGSSFYRLNRRRS
jgi:LPXTG-motif cell wall-anchored protein